MARPGHLQGSVADLDRFAGKGARLVVGHAETAAALPAARVRAENGMVLIAPAATDPWRTGERVGPGGFHAAVRSDGRPPAKAKAAAIRMSSPATPG